MKRAAAIEVKIIAEVDVAQRDSAVGRGAEPGVQAPGDLGGIAEFADTGTVFAIMDRDTYLRAKEQAQSRSAVVSSIVRRHGGGGESKGASYSVRAACRLSSFLRLGPPFRFRAPRPRPQPRVLLG